MQERQVRTLPGVPMVLVLTAATVAACWTMVRAIRDGDLPIAGGIALVVLGVLWCGFFIVQPNTASVLQFFGRYVGVERNSGPRWTNPFYTKKSVSLRVRNFESSKLKVNELDGSPIEIAAVVVWRVHDAAEATFNVDNYENFVHVQAESALRQMATSHPYDAHDGKIALRSHSKEINQHLKEEIEERLEQAGVTVQEARVSHLAYAPEIAQAMLHTAAGWSHHCRAYPNR